MAKENYTKLVTCLLLIVMLHRGGGGGGGGDRGVCFFLTYVYGYSTTIYTIPHCSPLTLCWLRKYLIEFVTCVPSPHSAVQWGGGGGGDRREYKCFVHDRTSIYKDYLISLLIFPIESPRCVLCVCVRVKW